MYAVFDMDGCLIDSAELIRQSYREAGVEPPDDILACEGTSWLHEQVPDPVTRLNVRVMKNERYLRHLQHDRIVTLPAYDVAVALNDLGHTCYMYTGAPRGAVKALKARLSVWPFRHAFDATATPARMADIRDTPFKGVYIDDQSRLVDLPQHWRFVHYMSQTTDELYREIIDDVRK